MGLQWDSVVNRASTNKHGDMGIRHGGVSIICMMVYWRVYRAKNDAINKKW